MLQWNCTCYKSGLIWRNIPDFMCNPTANSFSFHPGVWSVFVLPSVSRWWVLEGVWMFVREHRSLLGCWALALAGGHVSHPPSTHLQLGESHNDPVRLPRSKWIQAITEEKKHCCADNKHWKLLLMDCWCTSHRCVGPDLMGLPLKQNPDTDLHTI